MSEGDDWIGERMKPGFYCFSGVTVYYFPFKHAGTIS